MLCSEVQRCSSPPVHGREPPVPAVLLYLLKVIQVTQPQRVNVLREYCPHQQTCIYQQRTGGHRMHVTDVR